MRELKNIQVRSVIKVRDICVVRGDQERIRLHRKQPQICAQFRFSDVSDVAPQDAQVLESTHQMCGPSGTHTNSCNAAEAT